MQDKKVYEYAILRLVPRVEREEFMNIGLLMMSKPGRFIKVQYELNEERIKKFAPSLSYDCLFDQMPTFLKIANGDKDAGLIGSLPFYERFRWLTANRSTILQTSPVHGGITNDLEKEFEKLYKEYVTVIENS